MMNDCFADNRAKTGHSVGEPPGNLPAMQRQIGAPCPLRHQQPRLLESSSGHHTLGAASSKAQGGEALLAV
jgi:hypothetical protein